MNERDQPTDEAYPDSGPRTIAPVEHAGTWSGETHDDSQYDGTAAEAGEGPGHWRYELRRWLATLNPGRTGREYEKAVGYFFETAGVPERVEALSFDLLLAYRGALALRAADPRRPQPRGAGVAPPAGPRLHAAGTAMLPTVEKDTDVGETTNEEGPPSGKGEPAGAREDEATAASNSSLAPATVNIRLTALRQMLVHCAQVGSLPQLTPDSIRSALRRLRIERRRPYQVLSEPEWEGFLAAALAPAGPPVVSSHGRADADEEGEGAEVRGAEDRSPWGTPRAARQQRLATEPSDVHHARPAPAPAPAPADAPVRTRGGLTGARTAQRDHALIALALATGLRAIELSLLDLGDLTRDWHAGAEEWWLVLPDAKTKGQHGGRTLPLVPALVETLLAYIHQTGRRWERAADRATPLFLSSRKSPTEGAAETQGGSQTGSGRLTASQIGRIVDRVETQWQAQHEGSAGDVGPGDARRISPHALRHSTAIALLEGNDRQGRPPASVEHVRGWLGHFDIRTTQGYLAHLEARRHRRPFAIDIDTPAATAGAGAPLPSAAADEPGGAGRPASDETAERSREIPPAE